MQVSHHAVTVPSCEKLDDIRITFALEQGHSPSRSKGPSRDCCRGDAGGVVEGLGIDPHGGSDSCCANKGEDSIVKVTGELEGWAEGIGASAAAPEMEHLARACCYRAA